MSYPLRLPEHLDTAARERAASIGISFNAFICVCVEAYVNGGSPAPRRVVKPAATLAAAPAAAAVVAPPVGFEDCFDPVGYAECFGPDAVPDSPDDIEALVSQLEAKQRRINRRGK